MSSEIKPFKYQKMSDREKEHLLGKTHRIENTEPNTLISPRFYLIGIVLTLYYFSQGMISYIMSEWIQKFVKSSVFGNISDSVAQKGCEDTNHSDPSYHLYTEVQEQTARWQMFNVIFGCIPVLLVLPFLPSLSDHIGRKFMFAVTVSGSLIKFCIISAAIYFNLGLIWIVVAVAADGFSGSYYGIVSAASSYMADITKRSGGKRTIGLTILESLMLVNVTVSGVVIGYLINSIGYFLPTAGCAVAAFLAVILVIALLPESLEPHNRSPKTNFFGYLRRTFDFYKSDIFRGKRAAYILLIVAYFVEMMTTTNRANIETLYQLGMPFCWSSEQIGIFSALRHAAQGFVGPLFLVPLKQCMSDLQIGIFSALFNGGSFVLEGLAFNNLMLYLVPVPAIFSFLTVPMIKSIMSIITQVDKQGSLFAGIMCVECLCTIITNFVSNMMYAATVSIMHGFTFLVLGATCLIVVSLLLVFHVTQTPESERTTTEKQINEPKV